MYDQNQYQIRQFKVCDWRAYKSIRLKALQENSSVYLTKYEDALHRSDTYWQGQIAADEMAIFGLFKGDEIIGLTGVCSWNNDSSGKTAVLCMSFIEATYRGCGLSSLLYEARLNWARDQGVYESVRVSHRQGNEASRKANQRFGFQKIGEEIIEWPDGRKDVEVSYELRL